MTSFIQHDIKLHEDILDTLFRYKNEISLRLSDVKGLHDIDHLSINILNSENKLSIFSMTPSVEYNLIIQDLWRYDQCFLPNLHENNAFFWWSNAYSNEHAIDITNIKERKHGFTLGFALKSRIDKLNLIYSFATRKRCKNLKAYYLIHQKDMLSIGEYAFKLVHDLYDKYCGSKLIQPELMPNLNTRKRSYLKLIVDNT